MAAKLKFVYAPQKSRGECEERPSSHSQPYESQRKRVASISYPILAASICSSLKTNVFYLTVASDGIEREIVMRKYLPASEKEFASIINAAVIDIYDGILVDVPQFVEKPEGWVWLNPIGSANTIIRFPNKETAILHSGNTTLQHLFTTKSSPFYPEYRLGARQQLLMFSPQFMGGIALPISGNYRDSGLYIPNNIRIGINANVSQCEMMVEYPAIEVNSKLINDGPRTVIDIHYE